MLSSAVNPLLSLLLTLQSPVDENSKFHNVPNPYGSCPECVPIKIGREVTFHLYTKHNKERPHILEWKNKKSIATSHFNAKHDTILIIHGFGGSALDEFPNTMSNAYLKRGDYNIIRVDWHRLSAGPFHFYPYAVKNVAIVGRHIAEFMGWLEQHSLLNVSSCHAIGFSLGAHVAGFMGKALAPRKIARITGLDPAGPSFDVEDSKLRIDKSDADFVDIIHTNSDAAGLLSPIGHADFYANQGTWQPGCVRQNASIGCSHRRAWRYYAESILNEHGFPAVKCRTVIPIIDSCDKDPVSYMGIAADPKVHGFFLVHTNSNPPYAKNFDRASNQHLSW